MKYYLQVEHNKANHAGSKAVEDCEKIMEKNGYKKIVLYSFSKNKLKKVFVALKGICKLLVQPKGTLVMVEHPLYIHFDYLRMLERIKCKKIKLGFIIHDLESERHILADSDLYEKRDYIMFDISDYIIVHNAKMHKLLVEKGVNENKIVDLEIFDYLVKKGEKNIGDVKADVNGIVVAGNLDPKTSGYVYRNSKLSLNLYGVNFDKTLAGENTCYIGSFDADELPYIVEGKYGLIWYGNDSNECGGIIKEYLQYINPHKASSYIAAGLPIIISNNIGLADFVKKEKIGFTIDSLDEIESKINSITDVDYLKMCENTKKIAEKLKEGFYLSKALSVIEKRESEKDG